MEKKKEKRKIAPPFFEVGPKVYLYGKQALQLAKTADRCAEEYGVEIIFTAQYMDVAAIASQTKNLLVFAQHMDAVVQGRGVGAVLPEALQEAGAVGVLLNHAEKPLTLSAISDCIRRGKETGLLTMVCAGTIEEAKAVACLGPDIILAESPKLIGKGARSPEDMEEIQKINAAVHSISNDILILHGAGISDEKDVYEIIKAGADATGSTSGILSAKDPGMMLERMIQAVAKAWKSREKIPMK
ncbi:triose-phosphate isomerase [Bacteroidia bacterium]|nr:triose-phosphate isomerase [Bacteroidia bacterium]